MPDEPKNEDVFLPNQDTSETPQLQPEVQPKVASIAEPAFSPSEEASSQPVTEQVARPVTEPVAGVVTEPVNEPLSRPSVGPIGSGSETVLSAPVAQQPNKKRKLFIIGAIVAGAIVLFGGTSASAYFFWYQNPEKVVADSLVHAITAKTVSVTGAATVEGTAGYKLKIEASGHNSLNGNVSGGVKLTISSKEVSATIEGEGIFSVEGDIYVKVKDVQKLLDSFEEQSNGAVSYDAFGPVVKKIDGNWIKISKDDLGEVSEEYSKTQKCLADVSKSLDSDASFRKTAETDIEKLYKENKFIIIGDSLGSRTIGGQDSMGYPITADRTKADAFFTGFESTQLGKKFKECDDSIKFSDFADDYNKDRTTAPEVQLWVSRFGHTITELNWKASDDEAKGDIVINPVFNKNEAVAIPADTVSLKEVLSDIESAYSDLIYSSYESEMDTSVNYN